MNKPLDPQAVERFMIALAMAEVDGMPVALRPEDVFNEWLLNQIPAELRGHALH